MAIKNRNDSIVEVPDTILKVEELKAEQNLSNYAQMIIDSVMKVNNSSPMVFDKYLNYCLEHQKIHEEFKNELKKKIKEVAAFYICAPFKKNLKWPEITKFGLFVACLYENKFIDCKQIEIFDVLNRRIFNDNIINIINEVHSTNFAKFYLEISKRYPRMIKEENVKTLDVLQCFMTVLDVEYKNVVTELLEVFDNSLMFKKDDERISPSLKYFMHCILSGSDDFNYFVDFDSSKLLNLKFFFVNAILHPYTRLESLVKITKKLNFKDENNNIPGTLEFIPKIQTFCQIAFIEELTMKNVKKAKRPVGITKLIAELFINDLYPTLDFNFCAEKITEIVLKKPTMCNIMCFHNLVISVGAKINQHPKIDEIRKAKEFVEERISSSQLEFFKGNIDEINCEKIIELATLAALH